MMKCPLCGFNNSERAERCASCGAMLKTTPGLERDKENPNCYSFTPGQKIAKGRTYVMGGSGIDLVYKFSSDRLILPMVVLKILLLFLIIYETVNMSLNNNSDSYIFIPILILYIISILGWIFIYFGGKRKKRSKLGLGLMLLYSYNTILLAYLFMALASALYFSIATFTAKQYYSFMTDSLGSTVVLSAGIIFLAMVSGILILICSNFFKYTLEMLNRNTIKFYRFTKVLPILFIIGAAFFLVISVLLLLKEPLLYIVKFMKLSNESFGDYIVREVPVMAAFSIVNSFIFTIYFIIFRNYVRTYKQLFVPRYI